MLSGKLASTNVVANTNEMHTGTYYVLNLNYEHYESDVWVLDSGATRNICNNKQLIIS